MAYPGDRPGAFLCVAGRTFCAVWAVSPCGQALPGSCPGEIQQKRVACAQKLKRGMLLRPPHNDVNRAFARRPKERS
jgi:hypothetical protein